MTLRQFYDWQTEGGAEDISRLVSALQEREISWCMIGGLAVNHWAEEPMATADADLVIASEEIEVAAAAIRELGFAEKRFEWSIDFKGDSKVSIQISTEEMYLNYPSRSTPANVHGILMHVASLEDTLAGKATAYLDPQRHRTKKLNDILDIGRLLDAHPDLVTKLPDEIIHKINNP